LPPIAQVPALWTFAALTAGLLGGLALAFAAPQALPAVLGVVEPVGDLWLRALKATIVPLVAALLFTGIVQTVATAQAGAMARRSLGAFLAFLAFSAAMPMVVTPALLALLPIPGGSGSALRTSLAGSAPVTGRRAGIGEFLRSIVPTNVIDAAANDRMLPMILFMAVFALASTAHRAAAARDAGDVLRRACFRHAGGDRLGAGAGAAGRVRAQPVGRGESGTSAIGALAHYVVIVVLTGSVVFLAGYAIAALIARKPLMGFARAVLPAQTLGLSTQSSLASLPAMLGACRTLGLRETTAEFVLPLAVALFRATSPAMNLAVVIYVAHWYGVPLPA
jgi:Na+/H+-dicarboxylate symporter